MRRKLLDFGASPIALPRASNNQENKNGRKEKKDAVTPQTQHVVLFGRDPFPLIGKLEVGKV